MRDHARVIGLVLGATSLLLAWAMASPVGSVPDEPEHIEYAYGVATGQTLPGLEALELGPFPREPDVTIVYTNVQVPLALYDYPDIECYRFDWTKPASCGSALDGPPGASVDAETYMSRYPVPFYLVEGLAMRAGLKIELSGATTLLLTRVLSALICLAFVGFAATALCRRFVPRAVGLAMLAAVTPMAIYLFASINPNGLEIASAISLAAAICCVRFDSTLSTRTIGLSIQLLLFGSAVALSWARPISWLWAALLLLTLFPRAGLGGRRPLRGLHPAVITLVAANLVLAIAWTWYASRIRPVETSYADQWSQYPVLGRVLLVLLKFGDIVQQSIGVFGWLDTPLPSLAAFLLLACWTVIVVAAMWGAKPSALSPLVALLFLAAACACVALHSFVAAYGWQGRYVLPAIAAFFVLLVPSLSSLASRPAALQRLVWALTPSVLSLQLLSLVWNMWRHAYGFASYNVRLPPAPLPLRPLGWSPLTGQESVLVLAMVGLLSIAISSLWSRRAPRDGYPLSGSGGTVREGTDLTVRSPSGGPRPPG